MRSHARRSHQPESSTDTEGTGRENESTTVTATATHGDLRVPRLTASGGSENPEGDRHVEGTPEKEKHDLEEETGRRGLTSGLIEEASWGGFVGGGFVGRGFVGSGGLRGQGGFGGGLRGQGYFLIFVRLSRIAKGDQVWASPRTYHQGNPNRKGTASARWRIGCSVLPRRATRMPFATDLLSPLQG